MRLAIRTLSLALLAGASSTSCLSVRGDAPASIGASTSLVSSYWFRGTPRSTRPAVQGDVSMTIPLSDGGLLDLSTWANMGLSNSVGDGAFNDGQGFEVSEVDFVASYTRSFEGYDLTGGLVNYNFPGANFDPTSELMGSASFGALGLAHTLSIYYDIDEADGFYMSYAGNWRRPLDERTAFDANWMLGAMGGDQSRYYFGTHSNGLSDFSVSGTLSRALDEATTLSATLALLTTVDSNYRDALDDSGLDKEAIVLALGAAWSF